MNKEVAKQLRELLKEHGKDLCNEPRRWQALMMDTCGDQLKEYRVLQAALESNVPQELMSSKNIPYEIVRTRLIQKLVSEYGLAEEAAIWAVDAWTYAIGLQKKLPQNPGKKITIPDGRTRQEKRSDLATILPGKMSEKKAPSTVKIAGEKRDKSLNGAKAEPLTELGQGYSILRDNAASPNRFAFIISKKALIFIAPLILGVLLLISGISLFRSAENTADYAAPATEDLRKAAEETRSPADQALPVTSNTEDKSLQFVNESIDHPAPPEGLVHFWQEGSLLWSCGIWGSNNLLEFSTGLAEIDTDHHEFGEFMIWIDPIKANAVPGHGYKDNARFWSLDQKGAGLSSQEIKLGQITTIRLTPNTGRYGLGNP